MIHLVTSKSALHDVIDWLSEDDLVVVAGSALNALHTLETFPYRTVVFEDDKVLFSNANIDAISQAQWIDLLEASPCRTWS
jgi:fructose-specific component phosphotransferase system IIB-like protein